MSEKQFEKYLEKTMDKLHKETMKFYKKYPEYDKTPAEGFLSLAIFKDSISIGNSCDAKKRIRKYKDREIGKWRNR